MAVTAAPVILMFPLWYAPSILALPSDREQPIHIESDRALRNDKTGIAVYQGSVVINQGTIHIRADKVTVYTENAKVSKIICVGEPAHYQQQPKPDDTLVIAQGKTIEYHLAKDLITLIDDASLEQDGSTLQGQRINYDLKEEVIQARGDETGQNRTKMVIPPSQQQKPAAEKDSSPKPEKEPQ